MIVPADKEEYDIMKDKVEDIEKTLYTIASDLKLTVQVTNQNSKAIEAFLADHNHNSIWTRLHDMDKSIVICKTNMQSVQNEIRGLRALLWKVTGSTVSTLLGIVIYLIIKT